MFALILLNNIVATILFPVCFKFQRKEYFQSMSFLDPVLLSNCTILILPVLLPPQTWWAPVRECHPGLFIWCFPPCVRCGPLPDTGLTANPLRFITVASPFTVSCPVDNSTAAGYPRRQVDTHLQQQMGWLQGGEITAFTEGQEEEAWRRRASLQPHTGCRTCEKDTRAVGGRWNKTLLPRLQVVVDRYHYSWEDAVESPKRTRSVPPREAAGECSRKGNHYYPLPWTNMIKQLQWFNSVLIFRRSKYKKYSQLMHF